MSSEEVQTEKRSTFQKVWLFSVVLFSILLLLSCQNNEKIPLIIYTASGPIQFSVSFADSPQEHAKGLMNISYLPSKEGMLFIFTDEVERSFWMKDTLIPLDLIFINSKKEIVQILSALPQSSPPYRLYEGKAMFVLEVGGNASSTYNIGVGNKVSW